MKVGDLIRVTHWISLKPDRIGLYINEYQRDDYQIIFEIMIGDKVEVFFVEDGWDFEVI
jgi:hypothetical protein